MRRLLMPAKRSLDLTAVVLLAEVAKDGNRDIKIWVFCQELMVDAQQDCVAR